MTEINQKEYLKKYLGIGKEDGKKKKRKKKTKAIIGAGLTIVDDDLDISQANTVEEAVILLNINEDAPQIVGVIDERPMALRVDDYRKSDLWKVIGEDNDSVVETQNLEKGNSPPRGKNESVATTKRSNNSDSDNSPPRRNRSASPVDIRKYRGSDNSPPRRKIHKDGASPNNRNRCDSDESPRRKRTKSPENKRKKHDSNHSLANKKQYDSDNSPARKQNTSKSPEYKRKRRDSDNSPPRKRNCDSDNSPPRKYKANSPKTKYDSDNSPPRRNARRSPERNSSRNVYEKQATKECSRKRSPQGRERGWGPKDTQRKDEKETDSKSARDSRVYKRAKESESPKRKRNDSDTDKTGKKMTKTLDGKTAGLQNAKDLDQETASLKKREEEHFKNLSAEVSGVNAATIIRDRKTGKVRDLRKEAEDKKEKDKREVAHKEKYTRWGKGLKQVEDREEKLAQDAYEMSKPLARYVDDVDLEQHLKEQEREGDPMLAYIRSKKKKEVVASGKPTKPQYDGEFNPNRYGIPPGHRWDGVDRSSGYEKRWFETQNAKKAQEEDTYKWSTEDM